MDSVYKTIDGQPNLTIAEKYEQKMRVLNATIEAGDAYTTAFEDLASYTEIARTTGGLFLPGFGTKLEEFQSRLEAATKNRAFAAFSKGKLAADYAAKAVGLISEVDAILSNQDLTPSARRSLVALRGLGAAMESFGESVPGIGKGLEIYGQLVGQLTGAVQLTAQNVTALKGGSFSNDEQRNLGLGPGYIRTPLYNQGLPLVQELINERTAERTYLRTADGSWREVPYGEVTAIWSEYRFVNGDGPSPDELVSLLESQEQRSKLQQRARFLVEDKHADALMNELGVSGMTRTALRRAEERLQGTLQRLGLVVPAGSSAFKGLLKTSLSDPHGNDQLLRRMALSAHPQAREYFAWRGVDTNNLSLEELMARLIDYRVSGSREYAAHLRAPAPATTSTSTAPPTPTPTPPPITPPAKPAPGTDPVVRDHQPRLETTKAACEEGVQATVTQGREAYTRWAAVGRERMPWVFLCGSLSHYVACIPSNYEWVWKEVDGKVPQDKQGHSVPAACVASYGHDYDFQQCVWKEYVGKLVAWAAKKTAECPK